MHGHEPIIAMRLAGTAPQFIFVNDYPDATARDWQNPGEKYGEVWTPDHATVCTFGDKASALDFRFMTGLKVSITATTEGRAKALFELAKASGAVTVAACHSDPDKSPIGQTGWQEVWNKEAVNG